LSHSPRQVLCFGELLYRLAAPGREMLLQTPLLQVNLGGAEANVAIALARFGHAVGMVSVLPNNALGNAALGELKRHAVDCEHVLREPGRMGLYFLETGALSRPSEVLYDRAGSAFASVDPTRFDWSHVLKDCSVLHLSGITPALGASSAAISLAAVRAASALGVTVAFDGNYRQSLWRAAGGDAASILRGLIEHADVLFADQRDVALLLGVATQSFNEQTAAAAAFAAFPKLKRMASTIRSTRSVDHQQLSAVLFTRQEKFRCGAYPLDSVVDRIGGGDAFAAGVIHGLLSDFTDADALRFGLASACLKHSIPGDFIRFGVPSVMQFLNDEPIDVRR